MKENDIMKKIEFSPAIAEDIVYGLVNGNIYTKSGHKVRILTFDRNADWRIIALITIADKELIGEYDTNGHNATDDEDLDLVLQVEDNYSPLKTKFDINSYVYFIHNDKCQKGIVFGIHTTQNKNLEVSTTYDVVCGDYRWTLPEDVCFATKEELLKSL